VGSSPTGPSNSELVKEPAMAFIVIVRLMTKNRVDERYKKRIEHFALLAGIVQPLITLPQIIAIYGNRSAKDVSLLTWVGYLVFGVTFLAYGLIFNLKPIWVGQIIWVTMQTITVIGILIYS
jgi:uncharacterized protein with PQ loop repeat